MRFISIFIASAPPQIIKHLILELGAPCCKALPFPPFYTGRNGGRSVRSYLRISIQWQPRDSNPQPGEAVSCQAGTRPPPGPSGWFRFRLAAPCDVASAGWCPVRGEGAWEDCSPGPAGLPAQTALREGTSWECRTEPERRCSPGGGQEQPSHGGCRARPARVTLQGSVGFDHPSGSLQSRACPSYSVGKCGI